MQSNSPKALRIYASFLSEILNNKEQGNELLAKARDQTNLRMDFDGGNAMGDMSNIDKFSSDGTPCVFISGEQENLGIIT